MMHISDSTCHCYRNIKYPLYDVYNNAHNRGGRLNVTFDRYFIMNVQTGNTSLTESIIQRRTKYENRANMSDITMQVATIVCSSNQYLIFIPKIKILIRI